MDRACLGHPQFASPGAAFADCYGAILAYSYGPVRFADSARAVRAGVCRRRSYAAWRTSDEPAELARLTFTSIRRRRFLVGGLVGRLNALQPLALSLPRFIGGLLFLPHGTMKLFGFPSGNHNSVPVMSLIGAAGIIETITGVMMMLGFGTRAA